MTSDTLDLRATTADSTIDELLDELLVRVITQKIENGEITIKTLDIDANGYAYVDKEKEPELYDWVVNG
jgi:hypothetical protein